MTLNMEALARAMDLAFKFEVGNVVESLVAATETAFSDSRHWPRQMPESRLIITEQLASRCEQGVQPFYRCAMWGRDGTRAKETLLIPECELRLSEPFALPGSTEPEQPLDGPAGGG